MGINPINPIGSDRNINVDPSVFVKDSHGGNGGGYINQRAKKKKTEIFNSKDTEEDQYVNNEDYINILQILYNSFIKIVKNIFSYIPALFIYLKDVFVFIKNKIIENKKRLAIQFKAKRSKNFFNKN